MLARLKALSVSIGYWVIVASVGLLMLGVAIYYQYGLEFGPCVLCIHARILVLASVVVALSVLVLRHIVVQRLGHLLCLGIFVWLSERAWILFGTERGTIFAACGMSSGLPSWFALDVWFPTLFEVWESCGYTPELLFGVTMAEALIVYAPLMALISLMMFVLSLLSHPKPLQSEFRLFK